MQPSIAVIIATYNWPRALELVLWGYAVQTDRRFRVIVADDGSGPGTAATIARMPAATAQQLKASNQEQAAALQSIALGSADLRDIAQRLDNSVAHFKLDEADAGPPHER